MPMPKLSPHPGKVLREEFLKPLGLSTDGFAETELNIKNKISRGGFTAVFFVQCLEAIGCHTLRLSDSP
jgi:hypothetical protein